MKKEGQTIWVGLSGGVDSAVAALLLKKQGFDIQACFMKNWEEDDSASYCSAAEDFKDAEQICDQLQIPLQAVNFSDQYWDQVFAYCLKEYQAGRTPNPDILCNREIKFKVFLDYAKAAGADYIATGHYAQKAPSTFFENKFHLKKAADQNKDQTYFLYAITGAALSQTLFPIGHLQKDQVRALAQAAHFANARKKDSTGICFIGERKFKDFLKNYLPAQPGLIETPEGRLMGEHEGLMFYTLGQRQGLNIGGQKNSLQAPWYVLQKDLSRNVLIIGQGVDHPLLYADQLRVDQLHWIAEEAPLVCSDPLACEAKIRYRQSEVPCTLRLLTAEGRPPHTGIVQFKTPQRAITPGQSVVFYQHDICLGGGIIQ